MGDTSIDLITMLSDFSFTKKMFCISRTGLFPFARPFNQKQLGNEVEIVIISKHHQGYLDRFGGSTHEFYKYIELNLQLHFG